jgi:regulator of cell morphogenesis and NO signaling
VCEFNEGPDSIEDKINDLINMFVIHLTGDYDLNLGHAVLFAIFSLKKDIKQNNRIRNRILRPISIALSKNK